MSQANQRREMEGSEPTSSRMYTGQVFTVSSVRQFCL